MFASNFEVNKAHWRDHKIGEMTTIERMTTKARAAELRRLETEMVGGEPMPPRAPKRRAVLGDVSALTHPPAPRPWPTQCDRQG